MPVVPLCGGLPIIEQVEGKRKKRGREEEDKFLVCKKKGFGEREEGRDKGEWGRVWVE